MASQYNLICLAVTAVLLFVLPLLAAFGWKKRNGKKVSWAPLLIGAAGFLITVRVLELLVHMVCIVTDNPVSRFINGHTAAFVLYGILMAGIFEECGRYVILRFIMKKNKTRENIVMYGIGHGGIEVWAITLTAVLSYLAVAVVLYTQGYEQALSILGITEQNSASMEPILAGISGFGVLTVLLYIVERIFCMVTHISLTVLVFAGIQKKDRRYLPAAVAAHAVVDLLPCLYQRGLVSMAATEIWLFACSMALGLLALRLYKRME